MGAVYQAAALSKAFKVKPFLVRDAAVFPIQVSACHFTEEHKCHRNGNKGKSVGKRKLPF